ncbi:MAG TPA: metalloregulator ArsR/SmtB family transcription factor [bacterium]|jgi:DNA-binding transcriptional ArsR family regulator|nr:metalloregulator ArsR/SmtB family transcription factor [bacterium]HNT64330.1 metalloregulator ArsR/SmtB family transcription factor [bacterium]HOX85320.1 metalloregulator ArsR/SmtB family transcription factor [bacterium]HPG44479.1 metalloregulator ArsR/SmtB family transcription factor [bacterium]HPM97037.1 metalloregulator ArsR/SmtB family transcription factor [bacterium]
MKSTVRDNQNYKKLEKTSKMLKAMAHPLRLAIVTLLEGGAKLNVTQIFESLDIEQAVASHHLSILKDRDVLASERDGKNIYYSLKNPQIRDVMKCIHKCMD